jgi:hypothetical protein
MGAGLEQGSVFHVQGDLLDLSHLSACADLWPAAPHDGELARCLRVSEADVRDAQRADRTFQAYSLDGPLPGGMGHAGLVTSSVTTTRTSSRSSK